MKILDLFCGAGGAAKGISRVFPSATITGVDVWRQPNYPFSFILDNALRVSLGGYDLIWASPPCQKYSVTKSIHSNIYHQDYIIPIRKRLVSSGIPYIIENVVGAPLINPIMLCGTMFGQRFYRHRLFETSFKVDSLVHKKHSLPSSIESGIPSIAGHFRNVKEVREVMGIDWMSRDELAQAIPPSYSEYIASEFKRLLT